MLTNIFSIFDPCLGIVSSWGTLFFFCFFVFSSFWGHSFFSSLIFTLVGAIKKEIDYVVSQPSKGIYNFFVRVFFILLYYNFLSIFPYIFPVTSHLVVTLPFSFSFWVGIMFFI